MNNEELGKVLTKALSKITDSKVHKVGDKYYKMVKVGNKWSRVEVK